MVDVLIVGAGPSGLSLALELLKYNISFRIIEQKHTHSIHSKALAIQSRTQEIFEKMGVIKPMIERGIPITKVVYFYKNETCVINLNELDSSYPHALILPQSETEKILEEHLITGGGTVERDVTLIRINQGIAVIKKEEREEEIEAKWIIACDGAHSSVRHQMGIPFKEESFEEPFLILDVIAKTNLSHSQINAFLNVEGLCAFIPLPGENFFRIILPLEKGSLLKKDDIDEFFLQKILKGKVAHHSVNIEAILWSSIFYIRRALIAKMKFNNVFFVGDAAHVHSPAGGQGMNTGLQDAFNLSWKLALVLQNKAYPSLLETYHDERHPIAKKVLKETTWATKLITTFPRFGNNYFKILKWLLKKPKFLTKVSKRLAELDVNYSKSSLTDISWNDCLWKGPRPGSQAPDVIFNKQHLYNSFRGLQFILLLFKKDTVSLNFVKSVEKAYGNVIKALFVTAEKDHDALYDPELLISNTYKATENSYYLIRPDGYIAMRNKGLSFEELDCYLKKIIKK